MHLTIEVDYDADSGEDLGAVARALAATLGEQVGVTRVKAYHLGQLVAEVFSEDEDN